MSGIAPDRFQTKQLPRWTRGSIGFLGLQIALCVGALGAIADPGSFPTELRGFDSSRTLGLLLAIGIAAFAARWRLCERQPRSIDLAGEFLSVPRSRLSKTRLRVPFSDVYSLGRLEIFRVRALVIGVLGRLPILVPASALGEPARLRELESAIRERIGGLGDGSERLRRIDWGSELLRRATSFPWATATVCIVVTGGFWLAGDPEASRSSRLPGLISWGAFVRALIADGDWFRLVTPNFLNGALGHFLSSVTGLLLLGWAAEAWFGRSLAAWIAIGAGIVGIAGMTSISRPFFAGVGSSCMVYGLESALLVASIRDRQALPAFWRNPIWLWVLVAEDLMQLLAAGHVPHVGHTAGAITGAAIVFVFGRSRRPASPWSGLCAAAVVCGALGWGAYNHNAVGLNRYLDLIDSAIAKAEAPATSAHAARQLAKVAQIRPVEPERVRRAIRAMRAVPDDGWSRKKLDTTARLFIALDVAGAHEAVADELAAHRWPGMPSNEAAWLIALRRESTPEQLGVALEAMQRVVAHDPHSAYMDTLALLLYRVDGLEEAVEWQRRAWGAEYGTSEASHLVFLYDRLRREVGPAALPHDPPKVSVDGESREGDERIWLEVGDRLPNGGIVHAIAYRDEAPKALLEVRLGPRPPPRIAVRRFEGSARTFVVVWIGDIRPFELGEGRHTSRMREVSDSVGDYRKLASEESPPIE